MELPLAANVLLIFDCRPAQPEGARELPLAWAIGSVEATTLLSLFQFFFLFKEIVLELFEEAE